MKRLILLFFLFVSAGKLAAQQNTIDSLKHELEVSENDTLKLLQFILLVEAYEETKPDSSFYYSKNQLILARKLKLRLNEAIALNAMAYALKNMGNYPASLQTYLSAKERLLRIPRWKKISYRLYIFTGKDLLSSLLQLT